MQSHSFAKNIIVDGDEFTSGILGLDWFPSKNAAENKRSYENQTIVQLDRLANTWTGWCVMTEISMLQPRTMKIIPYHATAKDPYNATATPTDWAAATMKETTARDNSGNQPKLGDPRITGTGKGSDCVLNYSSNTWAPGSGAPTGPGASADEILLHEMVHGMRQMAGRMVREAVATNPNMDNYEEFVAILLSNMYRAETGTSNFRSDHRGFAALVGAAATAAGFKATYRNFLSSMSIEQPRLCENLRKTVTATYNPLHEARVQFCAMRDGTGEMPPMSRAALIVLALFAATILFGGWAVTLVVLHWVAPAGAPGAPVPWALATPWWVPALLWFGGNALGFAWLRRRVAAAPKPERASSTWRAPTAPMPAVPPSLDAFLRPSRAVEAVAFTLTEDGGWRAATSAAASCRRLRVSLDYAPAPDAVSGRIVGPARVDVAGLADVAAGQAISLAILEPDGGSWRLGGPEGIVLPPGPSHRCRLVFAADDRELQSVYFVVLPLGAAATPVLVDEAVFRYRDAWEAESPLSQTPRWRGR